MLYFSGNKSLKKTTSGTGHIFYNVKYFDIHVTVHRDKFLIIRPTRCTNFSNLFLE